MLHEQLAADPDFLARFQREARVAANLNHPNVVDVYDYGAEGKTAYIVMPYVGGGNLKERIQARGRLPPTEATGIARQVLSALAAAHARGLVHRDVKPQNVLLVPDGTVKLTDFGIAQVPAASELTQVGTTIGTAAYIAPEQATGAPVGPPADLYAVGLLLYEMLTGRPPFVGGAPMEVAYRQVNETPVPPRRHVPSIPPNLETVVVRALAKDPAARFPSAEAMLDALDTPLPQVDLTAPMATVPMPTTPPATSRTSVAPPAQSRSGIGPIVVTFVILGLLALVGLIAALGAQQLGLLAGLRTISVAPSPAPVATKPITLPTSTTVQSPTPVPRSPTPVPPTATRLPPTATPPPPTATPPPPTVTPQLPTPTPLLRAISTATAQPTATLPPPGPIATSKPGPVAEVQIPDTSFVGGFRGPGGGTYRGRQATLVYGARTPYSTMSATFELPSAPRAETRLLIVGLDSEDRARTPVEIDVDDRPIFRGPAPFADDVPSRPEAPWTEAVFEIPAGMLHEGPNTLTIRNLAELANVGSPPFLAINRATVTYRS